MNKKRILLADGNANMRQSLAEFLRDDGYAIVEVEDGLEALKRINTNEYDLVIAEIKMPKMDGIELLENIKQVKPNLPVILVSGFAIQQTVDEIKRLGGYKHLWKPYDMNIVKEVVRCAANSPLSSEQ